MKVDRRSFLGLGLGAVAGISVSPMMVKLTDDLSIWTQNWPWTPVPEDGEVSYEHSVCHLCPGSCGISVRKIDHRPVKIEGWEDHPVNHGGACLHGISGLQYLYDPSRVKTPLKKNGTQFEPISWDQAISMISDKLKDVRNAGTPEKLACIADRDQGSVPGLFQRLLAAFGSPHFYTMPSLESHLRLTAATLHGPDLTLGFDLDEADFILSFGAGLIEGWGSPVSCFKANASRKDRESLLYQIEPRLSATAANADRWFPIKPGTEADLALGICSVILKNNLFDAMAAAGFQGGFMRLAAVLEKDYSLEKTSGITGLKPSDIEDIATRFAKAEMPVAVFGKGRGDGGQSLKEMAAVHTLNCLVGNINKKGGVFVRPIDQYLEFPELLTDEVADQGLTGEKIASNVYGLFDKIGASPQPPVDVMFIYNTNPCYCLHDPKSVKQALGKVPFVVSFSSFLDETSQEADIVLPVHTFLERMEDVPSGAGLSRSVVGLSRPVTDPLFDTRHPGDIVLMIAKALDDAVAQNFEWESYEECLEAAAGGIWDALSSDGYAVLTEDVPETLVTTDISVFQDLPATVQAKGEGDLILIPFDHMRLPGSSMAASPFAVKTVSDQLILGKDAFVEINPATARGMKNNDLVTVTTSVGSARVRVHLSEGMMPGVIGMVRGLGHAFDNPYVAGKGANVNDLIGPVIEPGSGLDAAFGINAKISKA